MQILSAIPESMAIAVFKAAPCAQSQMSNLPEVLHSAAFAAFFPDFSEEGMLNPNCGELSLANAAVCMRAFARQSSARPPRNGLCIKVQTVCFSDGEGQDEAFASAWKGALQANPAEVTLSHVMLSLQSLQTLVSGLAQNSNLKRLKLSTFDMVYAKRRPLLVALLAGLAQLTSLESLVLRGLTMERHSVTLVPLALGSLTRLTHLQLARCVGRTEALATLLSSLVQLKHLDIRFGVVNSPDDVAFSDAISRLTLLTNLTLAGTSAVKQWAAGFLGLLGPSLRPLASLQQLDLSGNTLCMSGMCAVAPALRHMSRLQNLALSLSTLGAGCGELMDALCASASCVRLIIKAGTLQDCALVQRMCGQLTLLGGLQHLQLRCAHSTDSSEWNMEWEPRLSALSSLTHITFTDSAPLQPLTTFFLADLAALPKLQCLAVEKAVLEDQHISRLAYALPLMSSCRLFASTPTQLPRRALLTSHLLLAVPQGSQASC